MIKLFVVEDNELTLNYLASGIDWASCGIQVVGKALNGKKAIDGITRTCPDIVITDIRMPVMDGLELLSYLSKHMPYVKAVILTAHDEFSFAQKALKLGAVDYVLKPLEDEIIKRTICIVREQVIAEKRLSNEYCQLQERIKESFPLLAHALFSKIIKGYFEDEEQIRASISHLNIDFPFDSFCILIQSVDEYELSFNTLHEKQKEVLNFIFLESVEQSLAEYKNKYIFFYDNQIISTINFAADADNNTENKTIIKDLILKCSEAQNNIKSRTNYTVCIGISAIMEGVVSLNACFQQAQLALGHRFFTGRNSIIQFDDIEKTDKPFYYPDEKEKQIIVYATSGAQDELKTALESFYKYIERHPALPIIYIKEIFLGIIIQTVHTAHELEVDNEHSAQLDPQNLIEIFKLDALATIYEYSCNKLMQVCNLVIESRNSRSNNIVQKATGYMKLNFNKDISVESVADYLELNANYFSHIFKKIKGVSFTKYLLGIRMDKAKALLLNHNLTISDISESVGYNDPQYFSQLFKKHTGYTPSMYKKKLN